MSFHSSIHHILVGTDEETVFTPNQLNASVGDTILFTPVNLEDHIVRISLDRPCQADDSLSAVNFSRLIFPYLVTTANPAWFYRPSAQQDCPPHDKRRGIFSLNPSSGHPTRNGTKASVTQANSTRVAQTSGLLRTGDGPAASMLTAAPSSGTWPTSNSTSATNSSIWATGIPNPKVRPSGLSFSGRAATKEISRGAVSLLVFCYCVTAIF